MNVNGSYNERKQYGGTQSNSIFLNQSKGRHPIHFYSDTISKNAFTSFLETNFQPET